MSGLDVDARLVVQITGPSVEMRFSIALHSGGSYSLCLHDGQRTTLDASIVVRNGTATLRTRDGSARSVALYDGTQVIVEGHTLTVRSARAKPPLAAARAITRQPLDVARIERLLATLDDAVKHERTEDADAAFSAVRSAIDRAPASDGFFVSAAFSRVIARVGSLAAARRESVWVAWMFETLLRSPHLPDARAIDQLVFLPTDILVGNEHALEALIAVVRNASSPRETRLRETLELLAAHLRAHHPRESKMPTAAVRHSGNAPQ